jgi:hypothetical protein
MKVDKEILTDENSMIIIRWPDGTECFPEDLHAAAQATYKDHPSEEMRKFWGLT